jgi:hypothetical protein
MRSLHGIVTGNSRLTVYRGLSGCEIRGASRGCKAREAIEQLLLK